MGSKFDRLQEIYHLSLIIYNKNQFLGSLPGKNNRDIKPSKGEIVPDYCKVNEFPIKYHRQEQ